MAITMTAQQEADLNDPTIPKMVVWGLSFSTDQGTLAISNANYSFTQDSVTYEAGADKWELEADLTTGQALDAETLPIQFDGNDQYDPTSFLARLLANDYHLRPMLLRMMIFNQNTKALIVIPREYAGFVDEPEFAERSQGESICTINCETGTFRAIGKRHLTCSDPDQRRRDATDTFFKNTGTAGTVQVPFGVADQNIPGVAPGDFNRGGGGGGGGRDTGRYFSF